MAKIKNRIKNVNELPDWYSLKSYDSAIDLSALEWYLQLLARLDCMTLINSLSNENSKEVLPTKHLIHEIRKSPISYIRNNIESLSEYNNILIEEIQGNAPKYSKAVHPVTLFDIKSLYKQINSASNDISNESAYKDNDTPLHKRLNNSPQQYISIDLAQPNKVLYSEFKEELEILRNECNIPNLTKSEKNVDFSQWHEFGILPYIDLLLWSKENSKPITAKIFSFAIYPPGTRGEESVRLTTEKHVKSLIGDKNKPLHTRRLSALLASTNYLYKKNNT